MFPWEVNQTIQAGNPFEQSPPAPINDPTDLDVRPGGPQVTDGWERMHNVPQRPGLDDQH
jgi:hypothetical protein